MGTGEEGTGGGSPEAAGGPRSRAPRRGRGHRWGLPERGLGDIGGGGNGAVGGCCRVAGTPPCPPRCRRRHGDITYLWGSGRGERGAVRPRWENPPRGNGASVGGGRGRARGGWGLPHRGANPHGAGSCPAARSPRCHPGAPQPGRKGTGCMGREGGDTGLKGAPPRHFLSPQVVPPCPGPLVQPAPSRPRR